MTRPTIYELTDIPPGMTFDEYRRLRHAHVHPHHHRLRLP